MTHRISGFLLVPATCMLMAGCASDREARVEPEPQYNHFQQVEDAERVEVVVEVERRERGPFAWMKFWEWFDREEEEAEAPVVVVETDEQWRTTEGATYVQEEPGFWESLAFWRKDEPRVRRAPEPWEVDAARFEEPPRERRNPLAFWRWGEDREREREEQPERITERDVLGNMSPELVRGAETRDEVKIRNARVLDTNTRRIWDDLAKIMLLDRPSRLSLYPTP